jgi:hypothetical protein
MVFHAISAATNEGLKQNKSAKDMKQVTAPFSVMMDLFIGHSLSELIDIQSRDSEYRVFVFPGIPRGDSRGCHWGREIK